MGFRLSILIFISTLVQVVAQVGTDLELLCPNGWTKQYESCFLVVSYRHSWVEALEYCGKYGARLAEPRGHVMSDWLALQAGSQKIEKYWIGYNRRYTVNRDFDGYWSDGIYASDEVGVWGPFEPNTRKGQCTYVLVSTNSSRNSLWYMNRCDLVMASVCQLQPCPSDTKRCYNGFCIGKKSLCNGKDDCGDGSDEMECASRNSFYYNGSSGTIRSHDTGTFYPGNTKRHWIIEGMVGSQIQIKMNRFQTEKDVDYLDIREGGPTLGTSRLVGRFSGTLPESYTILSSNNFIIGSFVSDGDRSYEGFEFQWSTTADSMSTLNSTLMAVDTARQLYTPLYPVYYTGNRELTYTITTTGNTIITMEILDVDLCCGDNVTIYNGAGPESEKLITLQKGSSPTVVMTTGSSAYIYMYLKEHMSCKGLSMTYRRGCDFSIKADNGTVVTPGYEIQSYPGVLFCSWLIQTTNGGRMTLMFETFDLGSLDYLKVYDGPDKQAATLHSGDGLTGTNLPSSIRSSGQRLFLKLSTGALGVNEGFRATFSADCPGVNLPSLILAPNTSYYAYQAKIIVTCATGYYFTGENKNAASVTLSCSSGGKWDKSFPECARASCGPVSDILNGYIVSSTGIMGGDRAIYACNTGFNFTGSATIFCGSTATWGASPECRSVLCPILQTTLENGQVQMAIGWQDHGSVVHYSCNEYYELYGASDIQCSFGNWSSSPPACRRIHCKDSSIEHGVLNVTTPNKGDQVSVQCNSGYTPSGKNPFICGMDNLPVCNNTDECTTGTHQCVNADCVDTEGNYTCKCKPGYQPSGSISTQCVDVDECAQNGGFNYCSHRCSNTMGGYQCSCQTGYRLYTYNGFQNLFLLGGEDGTKPWHRYHINHTCVPVECGNLSLNVLVNGKVLNPKSSYFYRDTLTYLCDPGYTINNGSQGISNMYCQDDGSWTGTGTGIPRCVAKTCTDIQSYLVNVSQLSYKGLYMRQCPLPNSKIVQLTRYCGYDRTTKIYKTVGQDLRTCPVMDCGMPQEIAGARQYAISCTTHNCSFQFQCRPNYERQGNSTRGSNLVYCESDGYWGFGDIHCFGGQCPDPGYPPDGAMVATSFEEGSLVSFTCKKAGFQPDPSWPIKCQEIGGTLAWNGSVPECRDKQPPQFINCPSNIRVKRFQEPIFTEPTVVDNVGVTSFRVLPNNFRPGHPVESTTTITYEAYDFESNNNQCKFTIVVIDDIKPSLNCFAPSVIQVTSANFYQEISPFPNYAYSDEFIANLTAYPPYIVASLATAGRAEVIKVVAVDASGNKEECNIQFKIEVQKCSDWALKIDHGQVTCNSKAFGSGYDCRITCDSGYYFFENPNLSNVNMACFSGSNWDRDPPVCQAESARSVKFRSVTRLQYRTNLTQVSNIQDCVNQYRQFLVSKLSTLTSQLTTLCQIDASVTVTTPSDTSVQVIEMSNNLTHTYATVTLEVGPDGSINTVYTNCANRIYGAFIQNSTYVSSVSSIPVSGSCPSGTLNGSAQLPGTTFYCSDYAQPFNMTSQNKYICVLCPSGYYQREGRTCEQCPIRTYRELTGTNVCLECPSGTNSDVIGAKSIYDCYLTCPFGMYSTSGQAPCSDCNEDTYRISSTRCESCPSGKGTRGRGKMAASDCIAECPVGYFSSDGLSPCTACPVGFYQAAPQQDTCRECLESLITSSQGSTTLSACINGAPTLCSPNPCNTGICEVIDHDYYCVCNASYTGRHCEIPRSPCDSNPCYNGGRCNKVSLTSYTCICNGIFFGERCQFDVQQCTLSQCKNNGTCSDRIGSPECMCPTYSGYTGLTCLDARNPCTQYPTCQNGGTCFPHGSYYRTCQCRDGFTGYQCETNIDECASNPCINGGTCVDGINNFTCNCPIGYTGPFCAYIDETSVCTNSCTVIGESCVNHYVDERKYCICPLGYSYNQSTGRCDDIEKCSSQNCENLGSCFSIDFGYNTLCDCRDGYGGTLCQYNYNECASNPCKNGGLCTDSVNGYTCNCSTGTRGVNCELDTVNECLSGNCSIANRVQCLDLINSYKCICREGYTGADCNTKIPSCQSYPCQHGGTCTETNTSYTCTCILPWTGPNCQTKVDNCLSQCQHDAICYSSNTSFVCVCPSGYRGDHCEIEYNLCRVSNPCVGPGSNCSVVNGSTKCSCAAGYSGSYCQQSSAGICEPTTCSNGGTCSILNGAVHCNCPAGYTASRCETQINECSSNPCPQVAQCQDSIASYTCVCPQGKVGEDCDKDFSYNFDIVYVPSTSCEVNFSSFGDPQKNITAFTISLWVRFTKSSTPGTILNILASNNYTIPSSLPFQLIISAEDVVMKSLTSTGSYRVPVVITFTSSLMDGLWHHVAITWNRTSARIKAFKDGSELGSSSTGNLNLPPIGHVLLGNYDPTNAQLRATKSFEGRLSRLLILDVEYSTAQISSLYSTRATNVSRLLLNPLDSLMKQYKVDYSSELSGNICIQGGSNCTGLFNETTFPTVKSCSQDQYSVTARDAKPQWTSPVFEKFVRAKQTLSSGETDLSWGVHGVGFAAYSESDNAAVCTFRFFNKRANCSIPSGTTGGSRSCTTIEGGSRCTLTCNNANYLPWDTLPTYSTCGKYSSWGRDEGVTPYRFPACSVTSDLINNVYFTLRYDVAGSCDASTAVSQFRTNLGTVNSQWGQGLCNGVNCSAIPLSVTCNGINSMVLRATFEFIKSTLSNSNYGTLSPVDVLKVALVDEKSLNITNYNPDLTTLEIRMVSACATGHQVIGTNCVECGAGSKYVSGVCIACIKGEYQPLSMQTSCISCDGDKTTESMGSTNSSDCIISCFTGRYYNKTQEKCVVCPVGFYQDNTGSFYCKACAAGYTTQNTGSASVNDCKPSSGVTTASPPDVDINAGKSTAGGEPLSGAIIAIIVLAIGIGLIIIIIIIFWFCRDRLPCQKKVTPSIPKVVEKKQRYGEISMRAARYNMQDRRRDKDREPIIPEDSVSNRMETSYSKAPYSHMENSLSLKSGPVPIFTERMNGSVQKKTWMSSRMSQVSADEESIVARRTPDSHQKPRGRPPANLPAPDPSQLPRSLPPLGARSVKSLPPTDSSLRPSSGLNRPRMQVEPKHYQEFLDSQPVRRSTPVMPPQGTSPRSSMGSNSGVGKIYLESDEEI